MGETEEWKDVPGYEGLYKISSLGRVFSVRRRNVNGRGYTGGYCLKPRTYRNGYKFTGLSKNGEVKNVTIHRLVAESFVDNPEGKLEVNHIDGDKENNAASNLEWCTRSENNAHAVRTGLRDIEKMQSVAWRRNEKPVVFYFDGNEVARFPSVKDASIVTGLSRTGIASAARGESKMCDAYEVEYAE